MDSVMANSAAALVVLIGLTVFQVILGELMPKSLALQFPKQAALYILLSHAMDTGFLRMVH